MMSEQHHKGKASSLMNADQGRQAKRKRNPHPNNHSNMASIRDGESMPKERKGSRKFQRRRKSGTRKPKNYLLLGQ